MIATAPDTAVSVLRAAVDVLAVASLVVQARPDLRQVAVLNKPVTGQFLSDPVGRMGS